MRTELKNFIHTNGYTYDSFGAAIGVTGTSVYRYVKGMTIPDRDVMPRIEKITKGKITANTFYDCRGVI